jgi:uncharacterized protein (DUF2062 family)
MKKFIEKIKKFFLRFLLINDTPHKIAAGFSLGAFLGIIPGEGLGATLVLSSLLRFNRLAATAGVLTFNIWSTFFALPPATFVGSFLFQKNSQEILSDFHRNFDLIGYKVFLSKMIFFDLALPLAVGFLIVAGIIALFLYLLLYFLLCKRKIEFSTGKYDALIKK